MTWESFGTVDPLEGGDSMMSTRSPGLATCLGRTLWARANAPVGRNLNFLPPVCHLSFDGSG
ncbi:hypothetical protein BBP40_004603 [Aspergillus hancockii]|nr:hypothetical protein BBP40_004603 [Aspergillus hancockii]